MREALERNIKLVAALTAGVSLITWVVLWLLAPSDQRATAAITSLIALVVYLAAWRAPSVSPFVVVVTTVVLTVGGVSVLRDPAVEIAVALVLSMVGIVGVALLRERRRIYLAVATAVVLVLPFAAGESARNAFVVGFSMALAVALGGSVVYSVIESNERLRARYQRLFEDAPVALAEQDWTAAVTGARQLGHPTRESLQEWLTANPDRLRDLVGSVMSVSLNEAGHRLRARDDRRPHPALPPERVHPGSLEAIAGQLSAIAFAESSTDAMYETFNWTDGSSVTVRVTSIVLEDTPSMVRVLAVISDLTRQVQTQDSLERALASKDEFIASVSHELRTPLAAVVGLTSTLLERNDLGDEDGELLALISEQSNEMAHLIEDLLVASRASAESLTVIPTSVDPAEAAAHVMNGAVVTINNPEQALVWADPVRLRQILRNLITNAHRYGAEPIEVMVSRATDRVRIDVSDGGDPIPVDARDSIFQPYEIAHRDEGRTASVGLGLSVSRTLARLMGGDIEYHHNGRSVFSVTVPTPPEEPATT